MTKWRKPSEEAACCRDILETEDSKRSVAGGGLGDEWAERRGLQGRGNALCDTVMAGACQ